MKSNYVLLRDIRYGGSRITTICVNLASLERDDNGYEYELYEDMVDYSEVRAPSVAYQVMVF
jgi:hypothetical protein